MRLKIRKWKCEREIKSFGELLKKIKEIKIERYLNVLFVLSELFFKKIIIFIYISMKDFMSFIYSISIQSTNSLDRA